LVNSCSESKVYKTGALGSSLRKKTTLRNRTLLERIILQKKSQTKMKEVTVAIFIEKETKRRSELVGGSAAECVRSGFRTILLAGLRSPRTF
jgi:hypothetical protein